MAEQNIYITPDGVQYELDNQTTTFLMSIAGSGLPPITPITFDIPQLHGQLRVGYRLQPRVVRIIEHAIGGATRTQHYALRATLLDRLRPNRTLNETPGVLRKVLPDGGVRDLDVFVTGGMTLDEGEHPHLGCWHTRDVVEFTAYNPVFYDPTPTVEQLAITGIDELVFPITFPITFGGNIIETTDVFTNAGTWEAPLEITITGPVNSPTLLNETTGKVVSINYRLVAGETVVINTDPFGPSVTNSAGDDITGNAETSDLVTFTLVPGDNTLTFWGGAKGTEATCDLSYNARYIGY